MYLLHTLQNLYVRCRRMISTIAASTQLFVHRLRNRALEMNNQVPRVVDNSALLESYHISAHARLFLHC